MNTKYRWLAAVAASLSLSVIAIAQAPALDVKMGLWEISSTTSLGGQLPDLDLSKVPPAQRAQMEAALKAATGAHVTNTCMTREKFNKSNFMGDDDPGCKQTISTNTRTSLDASFVCKDRTGQMHIDASSPTSFTGSVKGTNTEKGKTMTMNMTMIGKWLSADCGKVK
jgi:hypothetical protein